MEVFSLQDHYRSWDTSTRYRNDRAPARLPCRKTEAPHRPARRCLASGSSCRTRGEPLLSSRLRLSVPLLGYRSALRGGRREAGASRWSGGQPEATVPESQQASYRPVKIFCLPKPIIVAGISLTGGAMTKHGAKFLRCASRPPMGPFWGSPAFYREGSPRRWAQFNRGYMVKLPDQEARPWPGAFR
jgi:hypothetical protein